MILLDPEDSLLNLEGQPIGIPKRSPASILEPQKADILVPMKDFVARLAGNSEIAANNGHFLPIQEFGH
jgi:hypothetical protein